MASAIVLSAARTEKPAPSASSSPEIHVAVNAAPAPRQASPGMVWIPGGTFRMGCDDCGMLSTDLGEKNNIAAQHSDIVQQLKKELSTWEAQLKAPMWPCRAPGSTFEVDGVKLDICV